MAERCKHWAKIPLAGLRELQLEFVQASKEHQKGNVTCSHCDDDSLYRCVTCAYAAIVRSDTKAAAEDPTSGRSVHTCAQFWYCEVHGQRHSEADEAHAVFISLNTGKLLCLGCDAIQPSLKLSIITEEKRLKEEQAAKLDVQMRAAGLELLQNQAGGKVGLSNLGNTCFLNSALQCLLHCEPVLAILLNVDEQLSFANPATRHLNKEQTANKKLQQEMCREFASLTRRVWSGRYGVCMPSNIVKYTWALHPFFRGRGQHDTHEFLRAFVDTLHEGLTIHSQYDHTVTPLAQKLGQDSSSINDLFAGRFASTITCTNCRHVSRSFEAFADLSLELPKSDRIKRIEHESKVKLSKLQDTNRGWFGSVFDYVGLTTPALSLYACLHSFCLSVNLADENKYKCEKCKETVDARKVTSIDRFPEVLSIHIKRFTWGSFNNKLTREVTFPLKNLDMSQFAADKKQSRQQRSSQTAQTTPRDHGSMKYDLTGLIRHMGDTGGGHYISFAKHHVTGQWYKFDDRLVTEVSTAEVEEQEAYVLFYRRQPAANLAAHTQLVKLSVEPVAVEAQSDTDVLVSKRWILNTNTRHSVPPVDNRDLACAHGVLLPALKQSALQPHGAASAPAAELEESDVKGGEESAPVQVEPQDRFVRISEPAFDGLVHAFGGGPKLYATPAICAAEDDEDVEMVGVSGDRCEPCHLQHLRDVERIAAAKADHDPDRDQFFYFLNCDWFNAWRAFVMQGKARPGPISNHTLLVAESDVEELELRPDLQKNKHYRGVYKSVWEFFMEHYGGGPMLRATSLDIYERLLPGQEVEVVEDNEVTMELSPDDDASEVSAGTDTDEREDDDDTQMDTVEDSS